MKKRTGIYMLLALLAGGCNSVDSPNYITYNLDKKFANRPVTEFFNQYGVPSAEFDHNGGGRVYRWTSVQPSEPQAKAILRKYNTPEGLYTVNDTYQGTLERHYCEVRIYTDSQDSVKSFRLAVDTIGKWSTSRCSEIFD